MSFVTKGSVAFVTGANRGIGRALVESLLARGAAKVYAAARQPESLASLAAASGGRVVPVEVQPEGKRRMTYDEFRRGLR